MFTVDDKVFPVDDKVFTVDDKVFLVDAPCAAQQMAGDPSSRRCTRAEGRKEGSSVSIADCTSHQHVKSATVPTCRTTS